MILLGNRIIHWSSRTSCGCTTACCSFLQAVSSSQQITGCTLEDPTDNLSHLIGDGEPPEENRHPWMPGQLGQS